MSKRTGRLKSTPAKGRHDDAGVGAALRCARSVVGVSVVAGGCALVLALAALPLAEKTSESASVSVPEAAPTSIPQVRFTDITSAAGIDFVHENGSRGQKLLPETMGGGCAFFDYDSDGDQDLLFVNSQPWPEDQQAAAGPRPTMALYRNDGRGRFEDVTAGSGLDVALYGMGAAVGDYDNDGRIDVFLSAVGANRLFHNEGNGKFAETTGTAGVAGESNEWSTGCGWFDYDNDGDLDLFVCNYVKWSREHDAAQNFRLPDGERAYGRPQNFTGAFPYLYRNEGNGKFTDISQHAGIQVRDASGSPLSKSLGLTFNDLDGDGWLDVVVANDTVPNQLFRNRGNGTFEEIGALAGIAFDSGGNVRGAMGIDSAHLYNDDALGIAIGNFSNEMTALYVSRGEELLFTDEAPSTGLGPNTRLELTFGVFYFDYDLDGRLDLFAANGHLEPDINRVQPSQRYEQQPQLFWSSDLENGGELLPVPGDKCGKDFVRPIVGRGASFADIDGDGDIDLLITAPGRAPRLLRNNQNLGHHWLRLKLIGAKCNRDAIGAQVEVELPDRTLRRHVMPTRSYLSQVELPLTIGLGRSDRVRSVTIRWPDGSKQIIQDVEVDRTYRIQQQIDAAAAGPSDGEVSPTAGGIANDDPPNNQPSTMAAARASCGHYLHHHDYSRDGRQGNPDLPRSPRPCHGPFCSAVPIDHHVPPSTPVRIIVHDDYAMNVVNDGSRAARFSRLFGGDFHLYSRELVYRIFRPPRYC